MHGYHFFGPPGIYIPFLSDSPTGQTPEQTFTHDGSNDAVSGKGVPFGVRKLRNNIQPLKKVPPK